MFELSCGGLLSGQRECRLSHIRGDVSRRVFAGQWIVAMCRVSSRYVCLFSFWCCCCLCVFFLGLCVVFVLMLLFLVLAVNFASVLVFCDIIFGVKNVV
jgi:hypothetical protein